MNEIAAYTFTYFTSSMQKNFLKLLREMSPVDELINHSVFLFFFSDANTLIECIPFSNLGKIQPFLVSLSTNAALLMDFHCHLTKSEVSGYLAGHWDVNNHSEF